jgi:hypothetical protein
VKHPTVDSAAGGIVRSAVARRRGGSAFHVRPLVCVTYQNQTRMAAGRHPNRRGHCQTWLFAKSDAVAWRTWFVVWWLIRIAANMPCATHSTHSASTQSGEKSWPGQRETLFVIDGATASASCRPGWLHRRRGRSFWLIKFRASFVAKKFFARQKKCAGAGGGRGLKPFCGGG